MEAPDGRLHPQRTSSRGLEGGGARPGLGRHTGASPWLGELMTSRASRRLPRSSVPPRGSGCDSPPDFHGDDRGGRIGHLIGYVRFHADLAWLVGFCLLAGAGGMFLAFRATDDTHAAQASERLITQVVTRDGETQTIITKKRITDTATLLSVGTVVGTDTVYGQAQTVRVLGAGRTVRITGPVQTLTQTEVRTQVITETTMETVTLVETVTFPGITVTVTVPGP